jgi:hypothetical protein
MAPRWESCHAAAQGRRFLPRDRPRAKGSVCPFLPRVLSRHPAGQLPREPPRETDFAVECAEGDGFRLISVSLRRSRGTPVGELPRGWPRETLLAARPPKGEGLRLPISPSGASVAGGEESYRDSLRRRNPPATGAPEGDASRPCLVSLACFHDTPPGQMPRSPPRETDFAVECAKGDGFRPISVSLACSRGTRHSALAARPPNTQKARLERRAFPTKLCSRARAYRLSASTGQEEMQAPHSMHSSSLTSA